MEQQIKEASSPYMSLYKFLLVLEEEQLVKLRNIAIGIDNMNSFSEEEVATLESRLLVAGTD